MAQYLVTTLSKREIKATKKHLGTKILSPERNKKKTFILAGSTSDTIIEKFTLGECQSNSVVYSFSSKTSEVVLDSGQAVVFNTTTPPQKLFADISSLCAFIEVNKPVNSVSLHGRCLNCKAKFEDVILLSEKQAHPVGINEERCRIRGLCWSYKFKKAVLQDLRKLNKKEKCNEIFAITVDY